MTAPGYFGEHAPRIAMAGYEVIPITRPIDRASWIADPGKQPAQRKGWQNGCPEEHWSRYAKAGLGILTRSTPALDIDVLDTELAEQIHALADRVLGDAPYRIGQAPKRLIPFRLAGDPFKKLKVSWRGVGDELHEPTKPPAVEVLTAGQQYVCLGIHPRTGQPYQWRRDPDLSIPHDLLPPLDQARAERFMRALTGALERIGAMDIKLSGARSEPRTTEPVRRPVCTRDEVARIEAALEQIGNHDFHYDDWIRIGHAIKAALPGAEGRSLWSWWSSLSAKNDPKLTARKWDTFEPREIGAGTILYLAGEIC